MCLSMTQDHGRMLLSVSGVMLEEDLASITINTLEVCGMELCPLNRGSTLLYVATSR